MPTKSTFFNPWDAIVAADIARADERRRKEIEGIKEVPAPPPAPVEAAPPPPPKPAKRPEPVKVVLPKNRPNEKGLACPVCFGVPETLRSDGETIARHLPMATGFKLYRDTLFCDGQGREGVAKPQEGRGD